MNHAGTEPHCRCWFLVANVVTLWLKMFSSKREAALALFEDRHRGDPRRCLNVSRNEMSEITKEDCIRSGE